MSLSPQLCCFSPSSSSFFFFLSCHVGSSSLTRNRTRSPRPTSGSQSFSHWTTREVPPFLLSLSHLSLSVSLNLTSLALTVSLHLSRSLSFPKPSSRSPRLGLHQPAQPRPDQCLKPTFLCDKVQSNLSEAGPAVASG